MKESDKNRILDLHRDEIKDIRNNISEIKQDIKDFIKVQSADHQCIKDIRDFSLKWLWRLVILILSGAIVYVIKEILK